LVRIAVAPALVAQPAFERRAVLITEWGKRVDDKINGLFPRAFDFQVAQDRHIRVVLMNLAELHRPPPHIVIAMNGR